MDDIHYWVWQTLSASAIFTWLAGFAPIIVVSVPLVYYCIMIFETKTVQNRIKLFRHWRARRLRRKIARLEGRHADD